MSRDPTKPFESLPFAMKDFLKAAGAVLGTAALLVAMALLLWVVS